MNDEIRDPFEDEEFPGQADSFGSAARGDFPEEEDIRGPYVPGCGYLKPGDSIIDSPGAHTPEEYAANDPFQEGRENMDEFEADLGDTELTIAMRELSETEKLLSDTHDRLMAAEDNLRRRDADLYNLKQEYGKFVRRSKEAVPSYVESGREDVITALVGVLDDIDAARRHGDLEDGPFASIATKLEDVLRTRFGLERFGVEGEDFDPSIHEALLAQTSADTDHPVLGQVLQPGYRRGEKILRATKAVVINPE